VLGVADLVTLARNTIITEITPNYPITVITGPTQIQLKDVGRSPSASVQPTAVPWSSGRRNIGSRC
jgi:hypothetical protein